MKINRWVSLLLCALLACAALPAVASEAYPVLYVGGVQVTPENEGDILGDGTASYNASTNTLRLEGARIHAARLIDSAKAPVNGLYAIYAQDDLTISLKGESQIARFGDASGKVWCGVGCGGDLRVVGASSFDDKLLVETGDEAGFGGAGFVIGTVVQGQLTVDHCTLQSGCASPSGDGSAMYTQQGLQCKALVATQAVCIGYTAQSGISPFSVGISAEMLQPKGSRIGAASGGYALSSLGIESTDYTLYGSNAYDGSALERTILSDSSVIPAFYLYSGKYKYIVIQPTGY